MSKPRKLSLLDPDPRSGSLFYLAPESGTKYTLWKRFKEMRCRLNGTLLWFEMRFLADRWVRR